ncbi:MAG TPA: family 16 glycoside hydrolase [Gemmataceae bacterium]|nr:family 16 glycoside hydrolase [Gemmataceae bacterium]
MRTAVLVFAIGLTAGLIGGPQVASQDKSEWTDLLARNGEDWVRDGVGKSPWRMTTDHTLACAAAEDSLGPNRAFGDGTFKFEYRFRAAEGGAKPKYNATLYLRGAADGSWCRLALGEDCGALTVALAGGGDRQKTVEVPGPAGLARAAGEWNQVEVNLSGKAVEVHVNARQAASFVRANAGKTRVALEVAGSEVEFRNVLWKSSK